MSKEKMIILTTEQLDLAIDACLVKLGKKYAISVPVRDIISVFFRKLLKKELGL